MRVDAEVAEGKSLIWPLSAGVASAGLLLFLARQETVTATTFVVTAVLLTALSFVALSRSPPSAPARRKRRVGADGRGLFVDGQLVVPRQTILRTRVRDEPSGGHSVIIEARGLTPSRIVRVESPRIAQALADTLEQTPHDVVEIDALPPWAHRMRWLTIVLTTSPWIFFNVLRFLPGWSVFVVLGLYAVIGLPTLLPQKIAIGEDGVLLRWAGRRRFVPFSELREVRATPLGAQLELDGSRSIEIRLTHRADARQSQREAMVAKIEASLANQRALEPAEDEDLLTRGERDLDAWIDAMSTLGAADTAGYRRIAMPRERLWAVLENPAADASARQGAALALRARLDEEERDRLVAIGQKSASPRLRIALDAVVHATDAPRLRVALDQAEADEQSGGRSAARARS